MTINTQEMRALLKVKAACLRIGYRSSGALVSELDAIKLEHVRKRSLIVYVNEMLGKRCNTEIGQCRLYWPDGERVPVKLRGNHNQPVGRYIANRFRAEAMPFRVEGDGWVKFI